MDIKNEVQEIFRNVFDDFELTIEDEMTAYDVADWNSLTHMQLICAIEEHFAFKFNTREIRHFKNIGDMLKIIQKKIENK